MTYNFQIFIMDMVTEKANWTKNNADANFPKLYKTLSNEQDVFNETLQIATDFMTFPPPKIHNGKQNKGKDRDNFGRLGQSRQDESSRDEFSFSRNSCGLRAVRVVGTPHGCQIATPGMPRRHTRVWLFPFSGP